MPVRGRARRGQVRARAPPARRRRVRRRHAPAAARLRALAAQGRQLQPERLRRSCWTGVIIV